MADLIDRDALIADLKRQAKEVHTLSNHIIKENEPFIIQHEAMREQTIDRWLDGFYEYLNTRKIVDAVPVVRCKDCANHGMTNCVMENGALNPTNDDDFCSYGERKEDE